jgi:hypothetical protein
MKAISVESAGWAIMMTIMVAALIGISGFGPIIKVTVGTPQEGMMVETHSALQKGKPADIKVSYSPSNGQRRVNIRINKGFMRDMTTESIVPEPDVTYIAPEEYIYSFKLSQGTGPSSVVFRIRPKSTGEKSLIVGIDEISSPKEIPVKVYN